jgi:hypothetical protein
MLTAQIDQTTFVVNTRTFQVGDIIDLTAREQKQLLRCVEYLNVLNTSKNTLLQRCHDATVGFDASLAKDFFDWEDVKLNHTTTTTKLLRGICKRLGGILPLQIVSDNNPRVEIRALASPDESVMISLGVIKKGTMYDLAASDMRKALVQIIGGTDAEAMSKVHCKIDEWQPFGAPFMDVGTDSLGIDLDYQSKLMNFEWADHEGRDLDKLVIKGLGAIVSDPNRLNLLRSNQLPMPFLAGAIGDGRMRFVNLTHITSGKPEDRVTCLQNAADDVDAKVLFMLQFGQLTSAGSSIDTNEYQNPQGQPWGFSVTLVMKTDAGAIIGAKSWTIEQQPNQAPSLSAYATFEDNAGVPDPSGTAQLQAILAPPTPELKLVADEDESDEVPATQNEEAVSTPS